MLATESRQRKLFIFVSDLEGNTLNIKEIENGESFTFDFPDGFNNDKVIVSVARLYKYIYETYNESDSWIYSYLCNTSEVISFDAANNVVVGDPGYSDVTISNIPFDYQNSAWRYSTEESYGTGYYQEGQMNFRIYQRSSPAEVLITTGGASPLYGWLHGIEKEDSYGYGFDYLEPMKKLQFSMPSATSIYAQIHGYKTVGASERFDLGSYTVSNENLEYFIPEGIFGEYDSYFNVTENDVNYVYLKRGDLVSGFTKPAFNFEVKNANLGQVIFTTTGDYDYAQVSLFKMNYDQNVVDRFINSWTFFNSQEPEINVKFPQLPEELTQIHPTLSEQNLELSGISLVDNFDLDSYQHYFDNTYKPNKIKTTGSVSLQKRISNTSGRMSGPREQEMLELWRSK